MRQVAVITDSIACLTAAQAQRYGIKIVPLYIRAGDKTYRDGIDITPTQAYELFLKNPDVFSTSAAVPADFLEAYRQASRLADEIICITLSSRLSTTFNSAALAGEYIRREQPNLQLTVLDSGTATAAEGMIVLAAARVAQAGLTLSPVIDQALEMKNNVKALVLLETIKHVYRSGRVPKIAAQAGSILNIRPLFNLKEKVNLCGVVRSFARGLDRIVHKIKSDVGNSPIEAAVMHAYAPEMAGELKEMIERELVCQEIWMTEFSPLIGYACGAGTVGVAYHANR
ncbi:MAG: DegV family protein [Dehalococcoidales bacterium]|nr:DegV family protein [Dehalococcoidales bacterium]